MASCLLLAPLCMEYPEVFFCDLFFSPPLYSQPLPGVICDHECNFNKYADDTELWQSAPPDECRIVQSGIQTDDILS